MVQLEFVPYCGPWGDLSADGPDDLGVRPAAREDSPDLLQNPALIGHFSLPQSICDDPLIADPLAWIGQGDRAGELRIAALGARLPP